MVFFLNTIFSIQQKILIFLTHRIKEHIEQNGEKVINKKGICLYC